MTYGQLFGQTVRKIRRNQEISQEALAEKAELSRAYIYWIESGRKQPTIETIFKLAHGLGVKAAFLIETVEKLNEQKKDG